MVIRANHFGPFPPFFFLFLFPFPYRLVRPRAIEERMGAGNLFPFCEPGRQEPGRELPPEEFSLSLFFLPFQEFLAHDGSPDALGGRPFFFFSLLLSRIDLFPFFFFLFFSFSLAAGTCPVCGRQGTIFPSLLFFFPFFLPMEGAGVRGGRCFFLLLPLLPVKGLSAASGTLAPFPLPSFFFFFRWLAPNRSRKFFPFFLLPLSPFVFFSLPSSSLQYFFSLDRGKRATGYSPRRTFFALLWASRGRRIFFFFSFPSVSSTPVLDPRWLTRGSEWRVWFSVF